MTAKRSSSERWEEWEENLHRSTRRLRRGEAATKSGTRDSEEGLLCRPVAAKVKVNGSTELAEVLGPTLALLYWIASKTSMNGS